MKRLFLCVVVNMCCLLYVSASEFTATNLSKLMTCTITRREAEICLKNSASNIITGWVCPYNNKFIVLYANGNAFMSIYRQEYVSQTTGIAQAQLMLHFNPSRFMKNSLNSSINQEDETDNQEEATSKDLLGAQYFVRWSAVKIIVDQEQQLRIVIPLKEKPLLSDVIPVVVIEK